MRPLLKTGALLLIIGAIFLLFPGSVSVYSNTGSPKSDELVSKSSTYFEINIQKTEGYRSVAIYLDGFVAAGAGGRLDRISLTGKILQSMTFPGEAFNSVFSDDKMIIATGDKGMMRISNDGESFRKIETQSGKNINSVTLFNGNIIAGADQGTLFTGKPMGSLTETSLDLKGNIVSLSSRIADCYGVTDQGEIIHTKDGLHWDIIDFNKTYAGYYKTSYFIKVLVTENRIVVAGVETDGAPVLLFSTQGGVWTERPLYYTNDEGVKMFLTEKPNDIFYDEISDLYYLACNKGKLMQLPGCTQCNEVAQFSEKDLSGVSVNENTMLLIGSEYFIKAMNIR